MTTTTHASSSREVGEVRAALAELQGHEAWALVRLARREPGDADVVTFLGGDRSELTSIMDIPLESGAPAEGRRHDRLVAVPFHQIRERGFAAHDDGTPLVVVDIATEQRFAVPDVLDALDDTGIEFVDRGGFRTSDAEYEKVVEAIIRDEIGQGEGANLVVGRQYTAVVADWGVDKALTVFRRLLERERGAYWTFLFYTGDRFLVGASPERHVSVHGGDVRMNPISGTFRVGGRSAAEMKPALLDFLRDEKEIYELFMVVDEELKMMCDICDQGGMVLGPFLKPMTHLVHTEYLLAGRSTRDVRAILRDTMYAATVTGSPVENACKLIEKYEDHGREYYASALALFGRDSEGEPTLDSPIVIRTADVKPDGSLTVTAGATLVRDSDPAYEVAETHAKAGGILSAFGLVPGAGAPSEGLADLASDEDVLIALQARNRRLSTFWLTDQAGSTPDPSLAGKRVGILDGEDDFVNMLRHVLRVLGMSSEVVRHERWTETALDDFDLVIVGPGPGDPRDGDDAKIATFRAATRRLLDRGQKFFSVCLGHQTLCHELGLDLGFKDIVFQGTQSSVDLGNRVERVGFYNTFVGRVGERGLPESVTVHADAESGDIHAVAGPHFRGIQFHAESILTERGFELINEIVTDLLVG